MPRTLSFPVAPQASANQTNQSNNVDNVEAYLMAAMQQQAVMQQQVAYAWQQQQGIAFNQGLQNGTSNPQATAAMLAQSGTPQTPAAVAYVQGATVGVNQATAFAQGLQGGASNPAAAAAMLAQGGAPQDPIAAAFVQGTQQGIQRATVAFNQGLQSGASNPEAAVAMRAQGVPPRDPIEAAFYNGTTQGIQYALQQRAAMQQQNPQRYQRLQLQQAAILHQQAAGRPIDLRNIDGQRVNIWGQPIGELPNPGPFMIFNGSAT